jgi:membrane protein DedA with SNARE-associated domain
MALESMIAPAPSEAVMPFVGFQVADGKWDIGWAILLALGLGGSLQVSDGSGPSVRR